jgi:hypothetical protein
MSYPIVAYEVFQRLDHIHDLPSDPMDREYGEAEDYDALIYKPTDPEGSVTLSWGGMIGTTPYPGSEPVNFVGFLNRLPHQTDFLRADDFKPIISKRMLYVLCSVGDFSHKAISIRIYDYGFQDQGRNNHEESITPPSGNFNGDYVGLQLLEHIDGIDYEHSEFKPRRNPERIPYITNLVLKEPINGFPPIFRLNRADERSTLFVSPAAKEALEEAGIKGLGFTEYEGTRAQEASTAR